MNKKDTIIEKAIELFSFNGYNGTGIQEIADASEIGKPTIYYYFGSKEGLLESIFHKFLSDYLDKLEKATDYNHDITLTLTEITRSTLEFAGENKLFYTMMLSMSFSPEGTTAWKLISPYLSRILRLTTDVFIKAESDHGNMKGRSEYLSMSFTGMLNTYATLIIKNRKEIDENFIYQIVHQFMHGVFS